MKVKQYENRLYKITLNQVEPQCLLGEVTDQTWHWHACMGHVNFITLKQMLYKNFVIGLSKINIPTHLCEGCLARKQTQSAYLT